MPIQPYAPAPFELDVADRRVGRTRVKQRARFLRLEHEDAARTCLIHLLVTPYAVLTGGGYGEALTAPPFTRYPVTLSADNNTLVDVASGAILALRYAPRPDGSLSTDADWQAELARLEAGEAVVMYQGDYFNWLRDTQPLVIGELIRHHIQQADALGRFA